MASDTSIARRNLIIGAGAGVATGLMADAAAQTQTAAATKGGLWGDNVRLTLVGGPTVLIDIDGFRLLTDPTFDAPGRYTSGAVTLEKTAGPALTAEEVGPVDAVLLSHDQHLDNLDHAGRAFLAKAGATFTTAAGAQRLGGSATGLIPFATTTLAGADGRRLLITATPARHGPVGIDPISGDVVGFLIGREAPGDAIYVTGDTVWYEGTAEVARHYSPRLVIVFAGAAKPRGSFHMTMSTNDVIETAHAFPGARIVPVHNHGWAHFKESAEDLTHSFGAVKISGRLLSLEAGKQVAVSLG
jgi:L-ascorbate metabolism protein UlaG (beta-lactamase superfamily)